MQDNEHASHHEESFISKYIFSLDHKTIGKQFLIYGLIMFFVGGGLALLFRWQLAYPDRPLPIIGASQEYIDEGEVVTGADRMWERIYESDKEEWLETSMPGGIITPRILQHALYDACHHYGVLRGRSYLGRCFRKLPYSVDGRHTRYGVSDPQHALLLARSARRSCHGSRVLRTRWTRCSRMDRLRTALCRSAMDRCKLGTEPLGDQSAHSGFLLFGRLY